jgi:hypothetical protein
MIIRFVINTISCINGIFGSLDNKKNHLFIIK